MLETLSVASGKWYYYAAVKLSYVYTQHSSTERSASGNNKNQYTRNGRNKESPQVHESLPEPHYLR